MINPTTPVAGASGAAQMREMAYQNVAARCEELQRKMDELRPENLVEWDRLHARQMEAKYIIATCLGSRSLPLPADPHAEQIAELTEELTRAKAELTNECRVTKCLYDRLDRIGHYRAMIERTMRGEYDDDAALARIDALKE